MPETYRDWRIKVRDAVVAASASPGEAFRWISEVWKEGSVVGSFSNSGVFGALDAKLMSGLTSILSGDFARKINTLKETEAAQKRQLRGRQVLFLRNEYFSTNAKHGSTYSLQDLFAVKLLSGNLRAFMTNWDTVLAGVPQWPDQSVLEYLFYTHVKFHKAISHDIAEYQRAEIGSDKHTYDFLVNAVRLQLELERLESNRERIARGLGTQTGKPSTGHGYGPASSHMQPVPSMQKLGHPKPPTSSYAKQPSSSEELGMSESVMLLKHWSEGTMALRPVAKVPERVAVSEVPLTVASHAGLLKGIHVLTKSMGMSKSAEVRR